MKKLLLTLLGGVICCLNLMAARDYHAISNSDAEFQLGSTICTEAFNSSEKWITDGSGSTAFANCSSSVTAGINPETDAEGNYSSTSAKVKAGSANNRTVCFFVTNITSVKGYFHNANASDRTVTIEIYEGEGTTVVKYGSKQLNASSGTVEITGLDDSKNYRIKVYGVSAGDQHFYYVKFGVGSASVQLPTTAPAISSVTGATSGTVTISNKETTATGNIFYTTDGTTPSAASTQYVNPFTVTETCTVKAIFIPTDASSYKVSSVASALVKLIEPLNVQTYTASGNWTMGSSDIAANTQLMNKNIQVFTAYAAKKTSQTFTIQGTDYTNYTQVRVASMPSNGEFTEQSGSTAFTIKCGKNGVFMVKYRRQNDSSGTLNSFTSGDGKDIHLSEAGNNAKISGVWEMSDKYTEGDNAGKFAWGVKQWNLEAGKEYVLWASGTTIPVFGFSFSPDHTVSTFTPGAEGYSTMCLDYDAVIPTGVEAYKGTLSNNTLALTKLTDVIPAKTPVVLKGSSSVTFKKQLAVAESVGANDLKGNIAATATTSVTGGTVCVLGYEDEKAGFYQYTGANLGANKAYLVVPSSAAKGGLSIVFDDDNTTAVAGVAEAKAEVKTVKFVKNGQFLIKTANGIINAAAAQVK